MKDDLLDKFNEVEKFHWWWAGRQALIKNLLLKENPRDILDMGCGTGETLTFLKTIFPKAKLTGVDVSRQAVKYTKNRGHEAKMADALRLPFADKTFDAVLLLDVVEHIKDDTGVVKEAKRVLKPGGIIIITVPALQIIWSAHDVNQGHFRRYTRHRLLSLAQKNQLKVSFLSYFNFFLSPAIILIRLVSRISRLKRLGEYDSRLNYRLAYNKIVNSVLRFLFITEIGLLNYISYPWGVSAVIKMKKP